MCHPLTLIFFADDSLFLCKGEPCECEEVMKIVRLYRKDYGQHINFGKSCLLFGKGVLGNVKQAIKYYLGIQRRWNEFLLENTRRYKWLKM